MKCLGIVEVYIVEMFFIILKNTGGCLSVKTCLDTVDKTGFTVLQGHPTMGDGT